MQAIDPLIQLLADADAGVKLHVITALKQLAPQAAHSQLQQLAINKALAPDLKQELRSLLPNGPQVLAEYWGFSCCLNR